MIRKNIVENKAHHKMDNTNTQQINLKDENAEENPEENFNFIFTHQAKHDATSEDFYLKHDFDYVKSYEIYFPNYNVDEVIKKLNNIINIKVNNDIADRMKHLTINSSKIKKRK